MAIKINSDTAIDDDGRGIFVSVFPGSYTNAQLRAKTFSGSQVGEFVYNSDKEDFSFWTGSKWTNTEVIVIANYSPSAPGSGNVSWEANGYTYHHFATPGSISANGTLEVEAVIIGGGGGGGAGRYHAGGGAGGLRIVSYNLPSGTTPVTVGAGGAGGNPFFGSSGGPLNRGQNGGASSFGPLSAAGGGGGSGSGNSGSPGGSGGGAVVGGTGGTGNTPPVSPSQGNPGGSVPGPWPGLGIMAVGGGGAGGTADSKPSNSTGKGPQGGIGGRGLTTSQFAAMSPKYPGVPWSFPSAVGPEVTLGGWLLGVCGGGSGQYFHPQASPQNSVTPANPIGGGGFSSRPQPDPQGPGGGGDANGFGGGGGGGGYFNNSNSRGGDGRQGVVLVRYLTSSLDP